MNLDFSVLTQAPIRRLWILALALAALPTVSAQPAAEVEANTESRYEFREEHSRDGIGKFYMGREIAWVMGHQAADWLERPNRDEEEQSEKLADLLRVRPGDVVADIGAGSGYHTRRLARRVGPEGRVLAVDIQPEMLRILTNKLAGEHITNVRPILGTIEDPKLPEASVDLVLMVDVYHEFSHPYEMMRAICRGLKPGGRVAFVEYRAEDPDVPIKPLHKMSEAQVKKEMAAHPLEFVENVSALPWQHVLLFRKTGDEPDSNR